MAGLATAARVFSILDPEIRFTACLTDGENATPGTILATVHGEAAQLLMGERVSLNLLQRMCGIATLTASFVEAVAGTRATDR